MHKYILLPVFSAIALLCGPAARSQNVPTTAGAPAGTITNTIPQPPEPAANAGFNRVITVVPMLPVSTTSELGSMSYGWKKITADYRDGFNRSFQVVRTNYSYVSGYINSVTTLSDNRAQRNSAAFLPFPSSNNYGAFIPDAFQQQKDYYAGKYPNEGYTSYSQSIYVSDNSSRGAVSYAPGKSNVGQGRGTITLKHTNAANQVRIWNVDENGWPVSPGAYAAAELFLNWMVADNTGAPGHSTSRTYTDKDGRTVMKQVAESGTTLLNYTWLTTYYVYDEMGRLRYTLPPKAVEAIAQNGWTVTTTMLYDGCFQYRYDDRGRLAQQRKPGEDDFTDIVYDRKERVVMRRSALEKAQELWEVSYYDKPGRVIGTSLLEDSNDRAFWQAKADDPDPMEGELVWYWAGGDGEGTVPAENAIAGNTIMSYSYYDDYTTADPDGAIYTAATQALDFPSHLLFPLGHETPALSRRTQGLPVASRVRLLPAPGTDSSKVGDWRSSYTWYDDKGRVIYTLSKDSFEDEEIHQNITGTQYDFGNRMLTTRHIIVNAHDAIGNGIHTEQTKNVYKPVSWQLSEVLHKVDDGSWKILATYQYDELGRLSTEVLGNGGETRDYSYTIRGQLRAINEKFTQWGNPGNANRNFGEILCYDYGFSQPRYDGKISGMLWRGSGSKEHAYGYGYDLAGRLKSADYRNRLAANLQEGTWNNTELDFTVSNLNYDRNGNITTMDQRGMGTVNGQVQPVDIDKLHYTYKPTGNRLLKVQDDVEEDYSIGDFIDGNTENNDYAYDASGNLTMDKNKGIEEVTYTWFNKPQSIVFANGTRILYSYDAGGNKLQELIAMEEEAKVTDYIANFVYRNDTLLYMLTGQGRTTISPENNGSNEELFVKDHLGNVRGIVDVKEYSTNQYLASYELASANLETLLFDKVAEIREDKPGGGAGDKAGRLNGEDSARITGTSILLKVMAGDQVNLQAFNYYEGYDSAQDTPLSPGAVLQSIVTTLTGGAGGLEDGESHDPGIVPKMFTVGNYAGFDNIVQGITDSSRPRAYLNYVLFDNRMKLVAEGSGSFQVNGDGQWGVIGTNGTPLVMPENGYIGIYTVNGTKGDVWFDQIEVKVKRGQLKEENHYYPFGLPMGHMGSAAAGMTENRRKYQSNEYIKDAGLNWMDFNFRQYDPQIGRFNSVDPLAGSTDMVSPYAAMGNAPEGKIDPEGMKYSNHRGAMPAQMRSTFTYGEQEQALDELAAHLNNIVASMISQALSGGGGGGSSSWSRGASGGQQYLSKAELTAIWNHILGLDNYVVGDFNIPLSTVAWYDGDFDGMPGIGSDPDGDGKYGIDNGGEKGMPPDNTHDIQVGANDYANVLQDYYESKNGGTYHLSIWRFNNIIDAAWSKQGIEFQKAKYNPETGIYTVPVNFYKTDYWASFGRATLEYRVLDGNFKNPMNKIDFIGFHDTWDLDPKPWGTRSISSEIITRWYNTALDGINFNISYP